MRVGVGLATAADPRIAAGEAAGAAAARLGSTEPTLAMLFTSAHFARFAEQVLETVHNVAAPAALVGCVAEAIVAGPREVEGEPAVAVWLAALARPVETFHMDFVRTSGGAVIGGYQFDPSSSAPHLLIPDPYTFPTHVLLSHLNEHAPGTLVMGGLASGTPNRAVLFRDTKVVTSGAVGVRLPGVILRPVVSQGCRPIGHPYTVTGAQGTVITELAGQPPIRLLESMVAGLPADQQRLIATGVLMGVAVDEYKAELARGDFLVRPIVGADEDTGSVQVGEQVEVGTTVQFHVRDAASADQDLRQSLARARDAGPAAAALLFTCNGRGTRMFRNPDHDASLVTEFFGNLPVAGYFAAGELGPVGGKNFMHGFTASLALLEDG
ncbi:MAG TPA: FIST N-terminal domain-containing protein [Jiangellaceae bacterium]|nr:FIST N-terminal domain-containing protein [Jiangellaceae bacterium]